MASLNTRSIRNDISGCMMQGRMVILSVEAKHEATLNRQRKLDLKL